LRAEVSQLRAANDALTVQNADLLLRASKVDSALQQFAEVGTQCVDFLDAFQSATRAVPSHDAEPAALEIEAMTQHFAALKMPQLAEMLMEPGSLQKEFEFFDLRMPCVMQQLAALTAGTYDHRRTVSAKDSSTWQAKRSIVLHSLVCKLLRARSRNTMPMLILAQGLDSYYQHIRECHTSLQLVTQDSLSLATIESLRNSLIPWIPRTPFQCAQHIRLILMDNLDMYQRLSRTRIVDGEVTKSKMIHCIVVEEVFIDASCLPPALPAQSLFNSSSNWDVRKVLPSPESTVRKLSVVWQQMYRLGGTGMQCLLERPPASDDHAPGITYHRSHTLQLDLHSNSKADMATVYDHVDELVGADCHKLVVLDYQTFAISWFLKHRSPASYKYYMFWGGELHRMMHTVDAVKHVFWESVLKPMAMRMGRVDIKLAFNADQYNNDEEFIRMLGVAGLSYLVDICTPEALMQDPRELLAELEGSSAGGLHDFVTFLLYGGLLVVADKRAMQTADDDFLDWSWVYTSVLARACNKTNYAKYGLEMHRVLHDTHEGIRKVIRSNRTYRESSHPCTGRGMDCGTERVPIE
jgi:hypothetical protein